MRTCIQTVLVSLVLGAVAIAATPAMLTPVMCSPGSPGSTSEAEPRMNAFASALSAKTGTAITAVYEPTEEGGVKRLAGAQLGIVSLPFFLAHEKDLGLH